MQLRKTAGLAAAVALAAPAAGLAQTVTTIEAESMTLSSYVVENGNRIKLSASTGNASKVFTGQSGTYNVQIHVHPETDGTPTLELYNGNNRLGSWLYPAKTTTPTTFTLPGVALNSTDTLRLVGHANGDAWARVDKIVLTPTASPAPAGNTGSGTPPIFGGAVGSISPITLEAESMALSSYVVEGGNRIKLNASNGSATKTFAGPSGNYKVDVYVLAESDGTPTLEFHNASGKVQGWTYPRIAASRTLTIPSVTLNSNEMIKLVGRSNGDAWARVDKIVFTPTTATPPPPPPAPSAGTPPPAPSAGTPPPGDGSACAIPAGGYEGFGKNTSGGAGKPIYRVTNLNDSGAGSLRDALSQGNRCVVFDVGGTISLGSNILVRGANVTIDGLTAPAPGVTLRNATLVVQGSSGAGNVVIRGIRHRSASDDALRVYNASNVVIDRVSVSGYGDGAIDVTESARNVTIQWSILGKGTQSTSKATLIAYNAARITIHHNFYVKGETRNPRCANSDNTALTADIVCDVRNNLVWDFMAGTEVRQASKGNVVNNYYYTTRAYSPSHSVIVNEGSVAYVSGNYSRNGWNTSVGNRSTPFDADVPATSDAITAAKEVLVKAGARGPRFGLDTVDQGYVASVSVQ